MSKNLSEETRDAQRRRLEENVGDMSAEARERQQGGLTAANETRKTTNRETAKCGECGEHKISDDYTRRQWQDRKKRTPTCRKCTATAEAQRMSQQGPLKRSRRVQ